MIVWFIPDSLSSFVEPAQNKRTFVVKEESFIKGDPKLLAVYWTQRPTVLWGDSSHPFCLFIGPLAEPSLVLYLPSQEDA